MLDRVKQMSISLGLYKPARSLKRLLGGPAERKTRQAHIDLLSRFIRKGDLVFDVGAFVGERADMMLSLGARVVAFEPQPILAREVMARGGKDIPLTVVQSAVGAKLGSANLILASTNPGMSSLRPEWDQKLAAGQISVPVTTLDAEIAKHGIPVFCKIDVEGFEKEVLDGLSTPLRAVSFEYHRSEEAVTRAVSCVKRLADLGNYEFNLTGTEEADLLLPRWLSRDAFLSAFPECAGAHGYGDVFARQ